MEGTADVATPEDVTMKPMTKPQWNKFCKSLSDRKGHIEDYDEFEKKVVEGLVDKATYSERLHKLVSKLFDILIYDLAGDSSGDRDANRKSGLAIIHILYALGVSASMDEVRSYPVADSKICVLVCGFKGCHVTELEPQLSMYKDLGCTTIASNSCCYPYTFHKRQLYDIAQALVTTVRKDSKLIVHMCSTNGIALWSRLTKVWLKSLPPYDQLPPLSEVLAGLVYECGPTISIDPKTGDIKISEILMQGKPDDSEAAKDVSQVTDGEAEASGEPTLVSTSDVWDDLVLFDYMGTIGGLCQSTCPDVKFHELASLTPNIMAYLRAALGEGMHFWAQVKYKAYGGEIPADYCHVLFPSAGEDRFIPEKVARDICTHPFPYCLVYSDQDFIVPNESPDGYVNHLKRTYPEDKVLVLRCSKSPGHCKVFEGKEREQAKQILSELIDLILAT